MSARPMPPSGWASHAPCIDRRPDREHSETGQAREKREKSKATGAGASDAVGGGRVGERRGEDECGLGEG